MRLYLLPISTRRTLLYCQKFNKVAPSEQTWMDKTTTKAATMWANWEKKEGGWQKWVVEKGNYALRRIPYEEWGLKSIPPLSARRRQQELQEQRTVEVVFPESVIPSSKALDVLRALGTEREGLHKRKLIWSIIGMPISAPFALVPVIPNLPFFYLVYRAWSHWRALSGGKHINFLFENNLLSLAPSRLLENIYKHPSTSATSLSAAKPIDTSAEEATSEATAETQPATEEETILLSQASGRHMVDMLQLPELAVEIERAIWQVETSLKKAKEGEAKAIAEAKPDHADANAKNDEKQ